MKYGIVYLHRNILNNKCYIGSTVQSPKRRWRKMDQSYNSYKNCTIFYKALLKYGWDKFETEILEENIPENDLVSKEEYYIKKYNALTPDGYNTTNIIKNKIRLNASTKKKISESRKEYYNQLEKPQVPVNKKLHKMLNGIKSKHCSSCDKWLALSKFGKDSTSWDNLNLRCKKCHNTYRKRYKHQGLSEEDLKKSYQKRTTKPRPFIGYKDGSILFFKSGVEASKNGYDKTSIRRAILKNKKYKGYIWSYGDSDKSDVLIFNEEMVDPTKVNIWRSMLNNNKAKIYGRKCEIRQITDKRVVSEFLNKNHLQGDCVSSINYGLFYNNEIVCLMTFGKPRYNTKYDYELIRFCSKLNTTVLGGASKLYKHFIKTHSPNTVISYANKRYSKGDLYYKLGFKLISESDPGYYYSKNNKLYNRNQFMKHKLKDKLEYFNPDLTEKENMKLNGYDILYDRGNYVFLSDKNDT